MLAGCYNIRITPPKFGISNSDYSFDRESRTIAKGMSSIKFMSAKVANAIHALSQSRKFTCFTDVLEGLQTVPGFDSRQLSILIHIDFFSEFGNQRELDKVVSYYNFLKKGEAKQLKKELVDGTIIEPIVRRHSTDRKKDGTEASSYTLIDPMAILLEIEQEIKRLGLSEISIVARVKSFAEAMGYVGYVTGKREDRPILYLKDVFPVKRKKDGVQFGYCVLTQSIGSGVESRFTVFNNLYKMHPIQKGDVIYCLGWKHDRGAYYTLTNYRIMREEDG